MLSGTPTSNWLEAAEQENVFKTSGTDDTFSVAIVDGRTTYSQLNVPSDASSPEASARAFLGSFSGTQGLQVGPNDLRLIEVKYGLASTHTRFQQLIDGVPVYGAYVSVHQGPDGAVQTVHTQAYDSLSLPSNTSVGISLAQAELSAMGAAGVETPYLPTRGELVWYPLEDWAAVMAWQVTVSSLAPVGEFLTLVNAQTGEVLSQTNLVAFDTGTGDIYQPNPYQTQGSGTGLSDDNDANSSPLEAQLTTVQLEGLNPGTGLLVGEFVDVATLDSPTLSDVDANEPTRVYQYTRDDARFEQVVVYDTIDSIQRYIQSLGFVGAAGIRDFPTLANAHWYTEDQSYYSTGDDALHFGDGGVDDGEDSDIIVHEYGHAVQHDQNALWGGGEMDAMGEGFGDYLAASFFADQGDAAYQSSNGACVGEWDATSYSFTSPPCLRRVDGNKIYPDDLAGDEHADGEIWSAALWDIRDMLGGPTTDQLVLEHHFALPSDATMGDAAEGILLADQNINGGANQDVIRQAFVDRGILVSDSIDEIEPNDSRAGAQNLDGESWNINYNANITNSTTIPHVSINGTGDDTFDYYSFTAGADDRGIFDIDNHNFDTELFLYDSTGNLLAENDDATISPDPGDGTPDNLDSFIDFTFSTSGTFVIGVAKYNSSNSGGAITGVPPASGDGYRLHVSIENHDSGGGPTFSNDSFISVPGSGSSGTAGLYPSTINVSGLSGSVSDVDVTLNGFSHTYPADVDILLVGPAGQKMILMSDVGSGIDVSGLNLTFDDAAASSLPEFSTLASGTFKPTNVGTGDTFSSPAPAGPYDSTLAVFNGTDPNGTWSLYVVDDLSSDFGNISSGWTLTITVVPDTAMVGDMTGDGMVNLGDVGPFVLALVDRAAYLAKGYGVDPDIVGDVDGNGAFDLGDISAFSALFNASAGASSAADSSAAALSAARSMTVVGTALGSRAFGSTRPSERGFGSVIADAQKVNAIAAALDTDHLLLSGDTRSDRESHGDNLDLLANSRHYKTSHDDALFNADAALLDVLSETASFTDW